MVMTFMYHQDGWMYSPILLIPDKSIKKLFNRVPRLLLPVDLQMFLLFLIRIPRLIPNHKLSISVINQFP